MMRMMKMELAVFKQYLMRMVLSLLIVTVCFTLGVGSTFPIPGMAFLLMMFNLTASLSNYDEHNDWGSYRLTMPLSRRDVVLGRYAAVLAGALAMTLAVGVVVCALSALAGAVPLPDALASFLRIDPAILNEVVFTFVFCGAMGFAIASVCMPVFFKFGQTKATQWLPFIMMLLGVLPFALASILGEGAMATVETALAFAETPQGLAAFCAGVALFSLVCYAASIAVSLRVYRARDL